MDLASTDTPTTWSLTDTRPGRLALRLTAAALGVGIAGGLVTAYLTVIFSATDTSPLARTVALGVSLALLALIIGKLTTVIPAATRWLAAAATAGIVLAAAVQGWPQLGDLTDDPTHNAGVALLVAFYGAFFGLAVALAVIALSVPAFLLIRATRTRITLPTAQILLTALAMVVTAAFTLWAAALVDSAAVTALAVTLAGTSAALTANWCLTGRQS